MDAHQLVAMRHALVKEAFGASAFRALSRSPLRTALGGAALGAGANVARERLRAEDPNRPRNYLQAAVGGAVRGGMVGGAVGGVGHLLQNQRLLDPKAGWGQAASRVGANAARGVKNFGMRQAHGLTGAYKDRLDEIGMDGIAKAKSKNVLLRARLADDLKHAKNPAHAAKLQANAQRELYTNVSQGFDAQDSRNAGLTSIPGLARAMVTPGMQGRAVRAAWKQNMSGGAAIMGVGLPTVAAATDLKKGDESASGGMSMRQKAVHHAVNLPVNMMTSALPIIPQMVTGIGTDLAANRLARGRTRRPVPGALAATPATTPVGAGS